MTSNDSFGVRFTRSWVDFYTRSLDEPARERRRAELTSDLWEQLHTSSGRASTRVLDRCLRGIPADVWWRYRTLLEQRGVRQRSQKMIRNTLTNWWAVVTAILGIWALTSGGGGLIWGDGGDIQIVGSLVEVASGLLILGGLALWRLRTVAGSRLIAAGAVLASSFMILAVIVILAGGLWAGHLRLSTSADASHGQSDRQLNGDITIRWYAWLVAAPILFVIGFGALTVMGDGLTATGEEDTGLVNGLAWLAWILSWFGAIVSTGIGTTFGIKRGIARHRTRPA